MSMLIDRAVMAAYGDQSQELLDIDDPALNEEIIPNFEGPSRDGIPLTDIQGDDTEEIELDITLVNPDPETDDTALVDQEPDTATYEPQGKPDTAQADASTHVETDTIPDCTGKEITIEERDNVLLQVEKLLPGKGNIQNRVDLLNEKSVPVIVKAGKSGGTWDKKKFSNNLRLAKKRMEDQFPVTDTTTAAQDPVESIGADDTAGWDQIPDCTDRTINLQERDEILIKVAELLPGREHAQKRADLLNAKGIPVSLKPGQYGGEWDRKKFTDNLRHAKKRLGVK